MTRTGDLKEPTADPKDVASVEAIIKATYDVISGSIDEKRDWDRFRSLFYKKARLIPTAINEDSNIFEANVLTPEEYIERTEAFFMKNGFFEKEIARRTEIYGNIVHVFSTYEGRYELSDAKPFLRGINSFQLFHNGKRWWIISVLWQAETPDNPLPEKYLLCR